MNIYFYIFFRYWNHEIKTSKNPSLAIPLIKLAGIRYISLTIYIVVEVAVWSYLYYNNNNIYLFI